MEYNVSSLKTVNYFFHYLVDRRTHLITNDRKYNIFSTLFSWCRSISNDRNVGAYVEQKAIHAMCALLCSGPMFSIKHINDDDYVYRWLELLFQINNLSVSCFMQDLFRSPE